MSKNLVLILISVIFLTSCTYKQKKHETVTVSILPQKYFVEKIAGNDLQINVMLPPGASPADYEPTTRQMQELTNSAVYFYIGHLGFEKAWMNRFNKNVKNVDYVSCSKGIDLLRGDAGQHEKAGDKDLQGTDPHIWTSPENVKTISKTICSELSQKFPDKADKFKTNLNKFISEIDTLDNYIRTALADSTRRSFMIFHPSMGYYARDYNLEQLSIEFEGKSPSPAHLKKMVDLAREKNIKTIFVQTQFETSKAKAVAREIGAEVVTIDPLAEDWLDEMYSITQKMAKALNK